MALDPNIRNLLARLHDPDNDTRGRAVVALREHTGAPEVQHALRSAIYDADGHVRMLAAEALARAALFRDEVIPVLLAILEVGDKADIARLGTSKQWRRVAAGCIGKYGAEAAPAIPALRNALLDPEANVRGYAAMSLGAIGPATISALQDLRAARQSEEDANLRRVYEDAIKKVVQSERFIVIARDDTPTPGTNNPRFRP
ncbi:MAG: HEAT repeat domain-containing protein [Verrucomicrobiota bacterium]